MIDLDTIDVSNLNRQFLFRPRHVGMPKVRLNTQGLIQPPHDRTLPTHHLLTAYLVTYLPHHLPYPPTYLIHLLT